MPKSISRVISAVQAEFDTGVGLSTQRLEDEW